VDASQPGGFGDVAVGALDESRPVGLLKSLDEPLFGVLEGELIVDRSDGDLVGLALVLGLGFAGRGFLEF